MRSIATASLFILITAALPAQQPAQPPAGKATITGIITLGDLNRPARFAHVSLVPATLDEAAVEQHVRASLPAQFTQPPTQSGNAAPQPAAPQPSAQMLAAMRTSYVRQLQLTTEQSTAVAADLTGRYTLAGVAPGVYYLHVRLDGYSDALDQFPLDQVTSNDPDTVRGIAALVQRIAVTGDEEQRIDVRLERGATLTGRVLYDDGAPAVGWTVTAMPEAMLHRKPNSPAVLGVNGVAGMRGTTDTDDLGTFRIRSLAPGAYAVLASITERPATDASGRYPNVLHMAIYSGDTFHTGEARTYLLTAGATRDVVLTVPLNKVHNVRGFVVAQSDGHSLSHGNIRLTSKDDPGLLAFTNLAVDGSFELDEVPAGSYTLNAYGVADAPAASASASASASEGDTPAAHHYGQATLPITLNDVDLTGVTLTVPDAQPAPASPSQ